MNKIVESSLQMFTDPVHRSEMRRQVEVREQQIVELGVCDVDCQWFGAAGQNADAQRVLERIAEIEQELETL